MKLLLGLIFATTLQISNAQVEEEAKIYETADTEPQFVGGETAMMKFIQNNIKYPDAAVAQGIQGIVYVQFVVNSDGTLADTKIVRGVDQLLDDEAARVINSMPSWIPGETNGNKVNVRYTLPIHFQMAKETYPPVIKSKKELKQEKKADKKNEKI